MEYPRKDKFPNYLTHIPPEDDPLATRTLFAGNLEINITTEEMKKIFGRFGNLIDVDIKRPPIGSRSIAFLATYNNHFKINAVNNDRLGFINQFSQLFTNHTLVFVKKRCPIGPSLS